MPALVNPIVKKLSSSGSTLNGLESLKSIYSLKKIVSSATYCLKVRRSNDNAEKNISWTGNLINTQQISDFCGANDGFVSTWYDQLSSNNLTQSSSNLQPKIFDGTNGLITNPSNNLAAIDTLTTSTVLANTGFLQAQPYGLTMVWRPKTVIGHQGGEVLVGSGTSSPFVSFAYRANRIFANAGAGLNFDKSMLSATHLSSVLMNGTNTTIRDNDETKTGNAGTSTRGALGLGAYTNGAQSSDMYVQELLVYNDNVTLANIEKQEAKADIRWF